MVLKSWHMLSNKQYLLASSTDQILLSLAGPSSPKAWARRDGQPHTLPPPSPISHFGVDPLARTAPAHSRETRWVLGIARVSGQAEQTSLLASLCYQWAPATCLSLQLETR